MKTLNSKKTSRIIIRRFILSIVILLLLGACAGQTAPATPTPPPPTATQAPSPTVTSVPPTSVTTQPDYWPTTGWRASTPEEQGMDSEKLAELMDYLQEQKSIDIHSLLIIRIANFCCRVILITAIDR